MVSRPIIAILSFAAGVAFVLILGGSRSRSQQSFTSLVTASSWDPRRRSITASVSNVQQPVIASNGISSPAPCSPPSTTPNPSDSGAGDLSSQVPAPLPTPGAGADLSDASGAPSLDKPELSQIVGPARSYGVQKQPSSNLVSLQAVYVSIMKNDAFHWSGLAPHCSVRCLVTGPKPIYGDAHLLLYNGPQWNPREKPLPRAHGYQRTAFYGGESSVNYPVMNDEAVMRQFDLVMTYDIDRSDVPYLYIPTGTWNEPPPEEPAEQVVMKWLKRFQESPVPFEKKQTAIVWLQRRCTTLSQRETIIKALMSSGKVPVHSVGSCLRNHGTGARIPDKVAYFRDYKFCFTPENSVVKDYFTEKTLDGLMAGCIPIINGPPNVEHDFLPDPNAVINYNGPSIKGDWRKLEAELLRLTNDKRAYEEKLAWKKKPFEQLSFGFQQYFNRTLHGHMVCRACLHYADVVFPALPPKLQREALAVPGPPGAAQAAKYFWNTR
mmetsp:Transcript_31667/g.73965  ORF Transcript_31667/g.73965 Transcript_31667/m.73965 type:complete len:493 (+) Transcript_31667:124-1602(+)